MNDEAINFAIFSVSEFFINVLGHKWIDNLVSHNVIHASVWFDQFFITVLSNKTSRRKLTLYLLIK